ncbi:hypothetical protein STSP2_02034 [Anaerohalosphaera lusitana]|uniref:Uncharacterized protein n=1 Tax=Anaerohalosphaera lusitana TaxID=1936003 RepID=A0A1U9NMA5_9BACT|nr:hypothetical protein [Anaerohalosphaera lusitana]AQT68858.1 hypothetical protein STSP2_02034 [Anaerohalosphaera lusitana]
MRWRDRLIWFSCLLVGAALLFGASTRLDNINNAREEMNLVSNEALENAPPSLAFTTVAMGAFRGLVVDILWMRADKLKEEGQFFDAKQLAEWITTLQPRFASVWEFQAWNMAYNISVACPASEWEERWKWVRNGYELLRDKGIDYNPEEISLYRQLAWIFQHKIGGIADDCNKHYKRELALAMRPLLGDMSRDYFAMLAAAPEDVESILKDEEVAQFVEFLRKADPAFADVEKLVDNYRTLREMPSRFTEDAALVLEDYDDSEALAKFDVFVNAYTLRNEWKMDPARMDRLNEKYGPVEIGSEDGERLSLNWEHPDAHAIYWAELGLEKAGTPGELSIDEKNTDRIVFHSLQNLFRNGKIFMYSVPEGPASIFTRPDMRMFDTCNRVWQEKILKYEELEGKPRGLDTGHKNFLVNAVVSFYHMGHKAKALKIHRELNRLYPREEHRQPLDIFVRKQLVETVKSYSIKDIHEMLMGSLREAYFRYAVGDDDEAYKNEKWAKDIYGIFAKEFHTEEVDRVTLPPFEKIRYLAFLDFLNDPGYPEYMRESLLNRVKLERPELFEKLSDQHEDFIKELQQQEEAGAAS